MSLGALEPRKRTSSFSYPSSPFAPNPRPSKTPRVSMGAPLRRTESFITIPPITTSSSSSSSSSSRQQIRRKVHINRSIEPVSIRLRHDPAPRHPHLLLPTNPSSSSSHKPPTIRPTPLIPPSTIFGPPRKTSPLAPTRTSLASRPLFPRSRPEPDLYRKALKTSMKSSPEGQKILRMGPRLAVSIMTATKELERLVAASAQQQFQDGDLQDVIMGDSTPATMMDAMTGPASPMLSKSWVVVAGEDWEMVDCAA